jgi:selenide, water dikinase
MIPEAVTFASMGVVPEGSHCNRNYCSRHVQVSPKIDPVHIVLLTDAQTSGGLLISVPAAKAARLLMKLSEKKVPVAKIIGEVFNSPQAIIEIL